MYEIRKHSEAYAFIDSSEYANGMVSVGAHCRILVYHKHTFGNYFQSQLLLLSEIVVFIEIAISIRISYFQK